MSKLVVYFSHGGRTQKEAERTAEEEGAEVFRLEPVEAYTEEDVDWQNNLARNVKEFREPTSRPEIAAMPDLTEVDELWVGYPIWWFIHPRIINSFFDQADLEGKKIHLFATSGATGIEGSMRELEETYPELNILSGERCESYY